MKCYLGLAATLLIAVSATAGETWRLENITARTYADEVFRLPVQVPEGPVRVLEDGKEIPAVAIAVEGQRLLYVRTTVGPGESHSYTVLAEKPGVFKAQPMVRTVGNEIILESGRFAVKLPAKAVEGVPAPVLALKLGERWVGQGRWDTTLGLKRFEAAVLDDGKVMGRVRLRYEFDGLAGLNGDLPAYAELDVTVLPDRPFAILEERHEMTRGSAWEFEPTAGWKATESLRQRNDLAIGTLAPGQQGYQPRELLSNLFPRWNQHGKDMWFTAAADDASFVGALVVLAGRWYWPHDNAIQCLVRESGDALRFRCPTLRGMRYWMLVAGPRELATGKIEPDPKQPGKNRPTEGIKPLAIARAYESLDTIVSDIKIREWEGAPGGYRGYWPLSSGINPTGGMRGWGTRELAAAREGRRLKDLGALVFMQVLDSPHTYGSYWLFWSPENPNFFTDFSKVPIGMAAQLRDHPRFAEIAQMAIRRFKEDMYHSVALPSGAGNECPGYQKYALGHYLQLAEVCKLLGEDATQWPRFKAGGRFIVHLSQPWGGGLRGVHPGGDTHGGGRPTQDVREAAAKFGPVEDVTKFKTEELENFGVVFRARPGTDRETYLAFKSGPSRGHFHGDQLSIHYGHHATPCAVDHHCSYGPRSGQEHMHNRVAFFTQEMPYANMDGFERVIAFKTTDKIGLAIGQVESWRLREVVPLPSEIWHHEYPQIPLPSPMHYRPRIVHVQAEPDDYFVIRDQYQSPISLSAAWCLHVWDNETLAFDSGKEGGGTTDGTATLKEPGRDFAAAGVEPGWALHLRGQHDTPFEVRQAKGDALVLDRELPPGEKQRYALFRPLFRREGQTLRLKNLTAFCARPQPFAFRFFPWCHYNSGQEATQGLRLETAGTSGEFITVLYPGDKPPKMAAIEAGVAVGADTVTFGGGIDDVEATVYVRVKAVGQSLELSGKDIDMDRFQGDIGLFVPDAGYPFGEVPAWLIRQRLKPPDWAPDWAQRIRSRPQ